MIYENYEEKKTIEPEVLVEVSPEDYDKHGNFRGSDPKRSKRLVPLHRFRKTISKVRKVREKRHNPLRRSHRIAHLPDIMYGKGIENDFIPYAENIAYEYYDDPNELCERLNLLIASKEAGNTNHDQEINSIIEELRESSIIK